MGYILTNGYMGRKKWIDDFWIYFANVCQCGVRELDLRAKLLMTFNFVFSEANKTMCTGS